MIVRMQVAIIVRTGMKEWWSLRACAVVAGVVGTSAR